MKANELMIDDWVTVIADDKLFPGKYVGKPIPCKVEGILYGPIVQPSYTEKGIGIDLRPQIGLMVRVVNNFGYMNFEAGGLSPIPLTPEILEKNGWIKDGYFYRAKDGSYIQLGQLFEHATFSCKKDGINREVITSPSILKYVHQLQHALRLCGINKEITL